MKIKVGHNQTLMDICIQYLGSVNYLWEVAMANDISITEDLNVGDEITIPDIDISGKENKIVKFFKENPEQIPATKEPE